MAGMEHGMLLFSIACSESRRGRGDIGLSMTGMAFNLETQCTITNAATHSVNRVNLDFLFDQCGLIRPRRALADL